MKILLPGFLILLVGYGYCQQDANDSAAYHIEKASTPAEKVMLLNNASEALTDANLKQSLDYAIRARSLALESNDEEGFMKALLNLGKCYTRLGRQETAMENFVQALEISQKKSDEKMVGLIYKLIGNGYYFNNENALALQYYKRALLINERIEDKETEADLQNNLALVYTSSGKLDSALINLIACAKTYRQLNKPRKLANALLNTGEVKSQNKQYQEAIDYYDDALTINRSIGQSLQEGFALNNIAGSLIHIKRYAEAGVYCAQALTIALREDFKPLLLNVYENLYRLNKETNQLTAALAYHEKVLDLKDSLYDVQKHRQMEDLRAKYESEQKERENRTLIQESELAEKQLNVTRSLLFFIALFAVIVTVLAIIYFRSLVKNRKANEELTILNAQIQEQKEEILAQSEDLNSANREIAAINENLEKMVEEKTYKIVEQHERLIEYTFHNSHQVRAPLARILGLINLIQMGMAKPEEIGPILDEIRRASDELDNVIAKMNAILEEDRNLKT